MWQSPSADGLPQLTSSAAGTQTNQRGTRWLETIHGRGFARKVGAEGSVDVDDDHYSISQALAGRQVVLFVNAPEKVFMVWLDGQVIKSVPIKGLVGQEMTWKQYVTLMKQQARSEERRLLDKQHRMRQLSLGI